MKYRTPLSAILIGAICALLAACSPADQQKLANVSADLVKGGAAFCAVATQNGPLVVALANAAGAPVSVTGQTATAVAAGCALINAIPVAPPASVGAVPVVASVTTLPAAKAGGS